MSFPKIQGWYSNSLSTVVGKLTNLATKHMPNEGKPINLITYASNPVCIKTKSTLQPKLKIIIVNVTRHITKIIIYDNNHM